MEYSFYFYLLLGLIVASIAIGLLWRLLSQRTSLPCPSWLSWMVEMDNPFTKINRAKTIIQTLDVKPGMRILDAGCGPGRLTRGLAEKVCPHGEVVAMDIQEKMLQKVQTKTTAAAIHNVRFLRAGLGEGNLEQQYYDCALLVTVLGEIPDKDSALKELFHALKPGGILSITELIFDPHFLSQKTVIDLATNVGFQVKNIHGGRLAYTMHFTKPSL